MNFKYKTFIPSFILLFSILSFAGLINNTALAWDAGGFGGCCGDDSGGAGYGAGTDDSGGAGYGAGTDDTSSYTTPIPAPSCSISASPTTVYSGSPVTLSWSSSNTSSASISSIGSVVLSGTKTITPNTTTTYTMSVSGAGGSSSCSVKVTVKPVPSCNITANPSSVSYVGSTTVSWTTSNASSASLEGVGSVGLNGSYTFSNLRSDKRIKLTVSDGSVSKTCFVDIDVQAAPAPSCDLDIDPNYVSYGSNATISWTTSNASYAYIDSIGSVPLSGSMLISNITRSKTYKMTVQGKDGTEKTCSARVRVESRNPQCSITASPNPAQDGVTTLSWTSNDASWATLTESYGYTYSVSTQGSKLVTLPSNVSSKTYTLTVGYGNKQKRCSVTINKKSAQSSYPSCSITASPSRIKAGQAVTLIWTSQNAVYATFADSGTAAISGSRVLYPKSTKSYKLIVTDAQGRQGECQAYVVVDQEIVPVVSVSSVPYTGPEDGLYAAATGLIAIFSMLALYNKRRRLFDLVTYR